MLTWEDGYYDNHEQSDASQKIAGYSYDEQSSRDSLGLAVDKMSLHVYSLGEGYYFYLQLISIHRILISWAYFFYFLVTFVGRLCSVDTV